MVLYTIASIKCTNCQLQANCAIYSLPWFAFAFGRLFNPLYAVFTQWFHQRKCAERHQPICNSVHPPTNMDNNIMSTTLKMYFHIICRLWIHTRFASRLRFDEYYYREIFSCVHPWKFVYLYSHPDDTANAGGLYRCVRGVVVCVWVFVYLYSSNGSLFAATRNAVGCCFQPKACTPRLLVYVIV